MNKTLLILVALVFAQAAEAQRIGTVYGAGTTACGEYTDDRKKDRYSDFYTSYVYGYLSAYNMFSMHPAVKAPEKGVTLLAYLDKYCADNPLANMTGASIALISELGGFNPKRQ